MKVLAINGSPRKNGNTALLLHEALAPLSEAGWEVETVQLGGKKIQGCRGCEKCAELKNGRCVFDNASADGRPAPAAPRVLDAPGGAPSTIREVPGHSLLIFVASPPGADDLTPPAPPASVSGNSPPFTQHR